MDLKSIYAGATLDLSGDNAITVADYPASDGWTLKYRLTPQFSTPTQAPIELIATTDPDGERYNVQAAPATTALWPPGVYTGTRWVEKVGALQPLKWGDGFAEYGLFEIKTNPTALTQGFDARSHVRKMLDQVQAAMLALNSGVKSYTIGTRSMTYRDMPELIAEESRLKWLVRDEEARAKIAAGEANPRDVGIRFGRL